MIIHIFPATVYHPYQMGSTGKAKSMLLRQYNFPHTFDSDLEFINSSDHDRLMQYNADKAERCFKKHTGKNQYEFESWARQATHEKIFAFLKDVLDADPKINWTGYRLLGSVNQGDGGPIWSLQLFAKHPKTKTKVYTGEDAPNVVSWQK